MAPKPDGGSAFPQALSEQNGAFLGCGGMSLRDYFAGQALAGLCANGSLVNINGQKVSHEEAAYVVADAMLKQRER